MWSILAPLAARAQDDAPVRITVREGDTCERIAARVLGDARAYPAIHALNPELGPTPHHLRAGQTLLVPRPRPDARLTAVHRMVDRRAPVDAAFAPARRGQALPRGTQVRTHDASSAEITFADDAHVVVRERTLVIVYGGRERLTQRRITRAELERGALRSRLPELAGRRPLDIDTPSARASLEGGGVVSVDDEGGSRVANHGRRAATVRAGGASVRVPANMGTVVARGGRPSAPRRLLAAPRWRADATGSVIGLVGRGGLLRGGFDPVPGAARYRVEVARDPEGGDLLTTLELGGDARAFEADGLPEGPVYVSVASIDGGGLEGRRSPWRAFTVRLARLVTPGGVNHDATEDVPAVWPGTWLVAPRGMDCRVDDEESGASILTLRRPGRRMVRCESGVIEVDVIEPELEAPDAPVERARSSRVRIGIAPRDPPPLTVEADAGITAGRPRMVDGALEVEILVPPNAPDHATLRLRVQSGAEAVPIGSVPIAIVDSQESVSPPPRAPTAPTAPVRHTASAFGDTPWPSMLGLYDERDGGIGGFTSLFVAEQPGALTQMRLVAGARAELPETPIRLGFASQLELLGRPALAERRGEADLVSSLGLRLADEGMYGLALDVTAFIPTRAEPESLGRVRLAPTISASVRPEPWIALRIRQGAMIDVTDPGARLYAGAIGVDVMPIDLLSFGAELDVTAGVFRELGTGAAFSTALSAELRYELLEIALGGRFGLTEDAQRLSGTWSVALDVRVFAR